jgi:glutamine synthetase
MCDEEKNPSILDPRNMLASILKRFDDINLKPVVAFELEFYLVNKEKDQLGKPEPAAGTDKTHVYGIRELDLFKKLLEEINHNCKIQNIPASTTTSEFAPGQYEINLSHTSDLLKAADDASFIKKSYS